MNMKELIVELKSLKANFDLIAINEPDSDGNEKLTLLKEGELWWVFYAERGSRNHPASFSNETEACVAFLERAKRDRSIVPCSD